MTTISLRDAETVKPDLLDDDEIDERLSLLDGWDRDDDAHAIVKGYSFPNRRCVAQFVRDFLGYSNEVNHHPNIELDGEDVIVSMCTRSVDGVTALDFDSAHAAERFSVLPETLTLHGDLTFREKLTLISLGVVDYSERSRLAWQSRDRGHASSTGGRLFSGRDGHGGVVPGDREKHKVLKAEWARVNNELLPLIGQPNSDECIAKLETLKGIVKDMQRLKADPGGLEGIGMPGGPRDMVIIGAGPGGMACATMGGADGLDTLFIDAQGMAGGQAKFSSRIENTMGFPVGVTGEEIARRMHDQAQRVGAESLLGVRVTGLTFDPVSKLKTLTLSDGQVIESRAVIIAGGVQMMRIDEGKAEVVGAKDNKQLVHGDAKELSRIGAGKHVIILGGSNGAAQAALGAARNAEHVTLISRSPITDKMSDYQVQAMGNPKITVIEDDGLAEIHKDKDGNTTSVTTKQGIKIPAGAVGAFLGGRPSTKWLPHEVKLKKDGKVDVDVNLETSMPGVFAVGDIRNGSIGRIGTAVADGQVAEHSAWDYFHREEPGGLTSKYPLSKTTPDQSKYDIASLAADPLPDTPSGDNDDSEAWDALVDDLFDLDLANPWFGQTVEADDEDHEVDDKPLYLHDREAALKAWDTRGRSDGKPMAKLTGPRVIGRHAVQGEMRDGTDKDRKRLAKMGRPVPPAYTDLRVTDDPKAELLATAKNGAGKTQSIYTKKYRSRQDAARWHRLAQVQAAMPKMVEKVNKALAAGPADPNYDTAMTLRVIMQTGLRNGGESEHGAIGASNLRMEHLTVDGDSVRMHFIGKAGIDQDHTLKDGKFADYVRARQKEGKDGPLFPHDSTDTLAYMKKISPGGKFKVHDIRTFVATTLASRLTQAAVDGGGAPKTPAQFKILQKHVAELVGKRLGDTPTQALESYIHPAILKPYEVVGPVKLKAQTTKEWKAQQKAALKNSRHEGKK